jgi:hypothetical protein
MGWLDNAIRRRMPVSLSFDHFRDTFVEMPDEVDYPAEDTTSPRTGE